MIDTAGAAQAQGIDGTADQPLVIVWHSRTGAARAMAAAALEGAMAEAPGLVRSVAAEAAMPDDVVAAGALLFFLLRPKDVELFECVEEVTPP